ncbi:MAG: hypothetical protein OXC96_04985, partial [Cyanobacteria bacterium MAG CAR1_bin_15]|nr:hypothetical protein [Cyanobacteria bacterium MAG CAR1_bin_15]
PPPRPPSGPPALGRVAPGGVGAGGGGGGGGGGLLCGWGLLGCLPGLAWHGWHLYGRGDGALVMWGRQGFGRLVQVLEGHNQGLSVPAFEILKGGWPWLLLLPLGLQLAWRQRQQTGGRWRLTVLAGCLGVVLSLKTQLPWYSHILWPPLACMEGPALARLWHGRRPGSLGLPLLLLGLVALTATVLQALTIVDGLPLAPLLMAGLAFGVSRILLLTGGEVRRSLGLVMAGWWAHSPPGSRCLLKAPGGPPFPGMGDA